MGKCNALPRNGVVFGPGGKSLSRLPMVRDFRTTSIMSANSATAISVMVESNPILSIMGSELRFRIKISGLRINRTARMNQQSLHSYLLIANQRIRGLLQQQPHIELINGGSPSQTETFKHQSCVRQ